MASHSEPDYAEKRMENHNKYFAEADKNNDGMLDRDEFKVYMGLWRAHMKAQFGDNVPTNEERDDATFEVSRVSGKDGITQEDYKTLVEWSNEIKKEFFAKQ
mmetsp:Transcript_39736/g.28715  ORF Transcript_39736/g.28715 Transcript_39736/m.28715 type:complete len:102 (+) Transcript_39736:103-408(+)|eukprot:CAMPEP_0116879690 /NCGR_PEP_ID=MMETSP0463-20121206/11501_1 /TAXON_ID=181622 /ORGANISM="Strombidinopsis sp, Strain SopsisLIS2011" /LENGTH=101 /DNA_ID=CAMNT_0004529285 /DNA_START=103 /DNA_END=408 /DNA_ORIENTATION=+